LYKEI
jgi:hypothetical protein